jgi:hypothetical protein
MQSVQDMLNWAKISKQIKIVPSVRCGARIADFVLI